MAMVVVEQPGAPVGSPELSPPAQVAAERRVRHGTRYDGPAALHLDPAAVRAALSGFGADPSSTGSAGQATDVEKAYVKARGHGATLVEIARRLGTHPYDLANLINFESGWDPMARNPNGSAVGLIQFIESTAKSLGTTTAAIKLMPTAAQLVLVEKYFRMVARGRDLSKPNVLYMTVFYPTAMDWPANREFPTAVQKANPGVLTPIDYVRRANLGSRLPTSPMDVPIAANASLAADLEEPIFMPPPAEEARELGYRDVQGSGDWRYRQHRDGSITIVTDPREGAPWAGKVLTTTDKAWRAVTSEIGPFPA